MGMRKFVSEYGSVGEKKWARWGVEKGVFVGRWESKWEKKAASIYPPPNLLNKIVKNFRLKRARIHELSAGSRQ